MSPDREDVTINPFTDKRYVLRELARVNDVRHYRLQVTGEGRLQSTDLMFTADHTAIFGDLSPGRNGVVSSLGYGLAFFSKERGARYLAEKFLTTDWHADLASKELHDLVASDPGLFEPDSTERQMGDTRDDVISHLDGLISDGDVRGFYDWFIDRHDFEALLEEQPRIAIAICRVLSRRLRRAIERLGGADDARAEEE